MSIEFQRDPFLSIMQTFLHSSATVADKLPQFRRHIIKLDQDFQQPRNLINKTYHLSSSKLRHLVGCNSLQHRHVLFVNQGCFGVDTPELELNFIESLMATMQAQVWQSQPRVNKDYGYPSASIELMSAYKMMRTFAIKAEDITIVACGAGAQVVQDWLQACAIQNMQITSHIVFVSPWFNDASQASELNVYQRVWQQLAANYGAKQKVQHFHWPVTKISLFDAKYNLDSVDQVKTQLQALGGNYSATPVFVSQAYLSYHWRSKNSQIADFIRDLS
ncbi:hypothetical protein [Paraferrimonas sp. SM1919]|uniref:hypothetical protein n=1 Tax=Paraferrimonas sp. SM1919 TaxID=2662263 RepID=UPI0013D6A519|nr:hypothetical protein [Paraferrimonas sp. SM1919]